MKIAPVLALIAFLAAGNQAFAMAQPAGSTPPENLSNGAAATNEATRLKSVNDTDWRHMPPPGVSYLTGGVGRVSAPSPAPSPAALPIR